VKGSAYKTRVRFGKATRAFNNTVLPSSLYNPGLYFGGGREGAGEKRYGDGAMLSCRVTVPDDRCEELRDASFKQQSCYSGMTESIVRLALVHIVARTR